MQVWSSELFLILSEKNRMTRHEFTMIAMSSAVKHRLKSRSQSSMKW